MQKWFLTSLFSTARASKNPYEKTKPFTLKKKKQIDYRLKCRRLNYKLLEKKMGEHLEDLGLAQHSLTWHQNHDHKRKNWYNELQKKFKLLLCKRACEEDEKIPYRLGENIFKLYV